jgi:hypothetical protein
MSIEGIRVGLEQYKRKFYYKKLSRGVLITLSSFLGIFIILNMLESFFWFNSSIRFLFLALLLIAFFVPIYALVLLPIFEIFKLRKGISELQIAREIGKFFPQIDDKLLNLLELDELNHSSRSLIAASIKQKEEKLKLVDFSKAIDLNVNLKYLYAFLIIVFSLGLLSFINPVIISDGTQRIIKFGEEFEKPMPFNIEITNSVLRAYKNEEFNLNINIEGDQIPANLYLHFENNRKTKIQTADNQHYSYSFSNVQKPITFKIEGAGHFSKSYEIDLVNRPEISESAFKISEICQSFR